MLDSIYHMHFNFNISNVYICTFLVLAFNIVDMLSLWIDSTI